MWPWKQCRWHITDSNYLKYKRWSKKLQAGHMLSCVPVKFWVTSLVRKFASSQEAEHFSRTGRSFIHLNWECAWRTFLQGDCANRGSAHEWCFPSCQHWNRLGEGRRGLWDQCAGLGQAVGNTGLPWEQEYMQLSRLDIISSLLSEELIVYSMSQHFLNLGKSAWRHLLMFSRPLTAPGWKSNHFPKLQPLKITIQSDTG